MPLATRAGTASARRFAPWAVGPWLVLLFAALGSVQYLAHGEYPYLAAALVVVLVSAGCVMRLPWALPAMRVLAVVLAAWALVSGVLMLRDWGDFEVARQHARTQSQLGQIALWMIDRAQRTWQVALVLKTVSIPLLLWLAWQLGRPAVRAQFRPRSSVIAKTKR